MRLPTVPRFLTAIFLICPAASHATIDPGEILVAEMNCIACHETSPEIATRLASRPSPRLDPAHAIPITPAWMKAFLLDPQGTQPGTLMPDMLGGMDPSARSEVAEVLTHYLVQLRGPGQPPASSAAGSAPIETGKTLYHAVGCVACHAPQELPTEKTNSPDAWAELDKLRQTSVPLGSLDLKYAPESLAAFLLDPLKARPGGRMPSLKLTASESMAIATYLLRNPASAAGAAATPKPPVAEAQFAVDPAKAARGKELFTSLNCAACHPLGEPGRKAKPMARLNGRQPSGCLGTRPKPGVPRFEISDRQRVVILAHLANQALLSEPLTPEQQITRTMTALNCYACHLRDRRGAIDGLRRDYFMSTLDLGDEGRIPPSLRGVGAKLRPESIQAVLTSGDAVRPYMATRMPQYGSENVGHLPQLFVQADFRADAPAPPADRSAALVSAGRQLAGSGALNCISCHDFAGRKSPGVPGLDLAKAANRLNWDWFRRYLLDPSSFRSGTHMPAFWPQGAAVEKGVLDGDSEMQIQAIWIYLTQRDFAELPAGIGKPK